MLDRDRTRRKISHYEWGVFHPATSEEHRWGMQESDARKWIEEFVALGGRPGAFTLIRRAVGEWERVYE